MQSHYPISPIQSQVARKYLGWTQEALAKSAGVVRSTIGGFEDGFSVRRDTIVKIRKAFEQNGIEFIEGEGVRRRGNEIKMFRGYDSCVMFYNDMIHTAQAAGGDIHCVTKSQDLFLRALGVVDSDGMGQVELLGRTAKIKCLITEPSSELINVPSVQFRTTNAWTVQPSFFFGYGNKYVHAIEYGRTDFVFTVFHIALAAHEYRTKFLLTWEDAFPLRLPLNVSSDNRAQTAVGM